MHRLDGQWIYSASDLNDYLECSRLTELEALVAAGKLSLPQTDDPQGDLVRRKGEEHEQAYLAAALDHFAGDVEQFDRCDGRIEAYREAEAATLAAMRRGVQLIYQATFFDGQFLGRADFLRRIDGVASDFGNYSYEVIDTKLGLSAKPYYLVQLCNYSEHLQRLQGRMPEFGHVVFGNGNAQAFRLDDYMAYYRRLKRTFVEFAGEPAFQAMDAPRAYPLKVGHCRHCRWKEQCAQKRTDDDHLGLVAWMRRDQIQKLQGGGIARVGELAEAGDELRPNGMSRETFTKLRRQASLQVRGRTSGEPIFEILEHEPPLGFALLPNPAAGDVFFDMEGDPLYEPGTGLEYLFGCWTPDDDPKFRAFWGTSRAEERRAFEDFIDFIVERRRRYPSLHVYHYANYEKTALRRLAQEHCTREDEVDDLLRGEVLVDLFAVVRQALAISEDGYGLKKLERFYEFKRDTDVKKGDESIVMFERWLLERDAAILRDIEAYNRDDCRSTQILRDWLLQRRDQAIAQFGIDFPLRPVKQPNEPCHAEFEPSCKKCVDRRNDEREEERRTTLERALLAGVLAPRSDEEYALMQPDRRMRYLLGNLLAYHRREEKPGWWEYYDRCENVDNLIEFDKHAMGGLALREDVEVQQVKRSKVYTYQFPDQAYKLSAGDEVHDPRKRRGVGTILSIDGDENLLRLKTTSETETARAVTEFIPAPPPRTNEQRRALRRLAESFVAGKMDDEYPAAYDLLSNARPRVTPAFAAPDSRAVIRLQPDVVSAESVSSVVQALDNSYLFIQGPPGSGKSTFGSQVICDLIEAGKRVAVTSTSHKAIHNLLHKVEDCVGRRGKAFVGRYKHTEPESEYHSKLPVPFIESTKRNEEFSSSEYDLAGGTAWLFAREELCQKFDYLFIDEAGQVSLADALAVSQCAKNVVLLGDPSQLAQVSQGRQPLHAGDSVLQHLLGNDKTVSDDRGIFLNLTYRMQPQICAFISQAMYDCRLEPAQNAKEHHVLAHGQRLDGLYFLGVPHENNGSSSPEEADEIVRQIVLLCEEQSVADGDVIVVTPYNAQRRLIARKLRDAGLDVPVGTVDKFQGQEAAIVFYSMATSSGADVPRDLQFLFERNRFNVAISRARAMSVLVCSPRLLDVACTTPEQMALVNLLCLFAEQAHQGAPIVHAPGQVLTARGCTPGSQNRFVQQSPNSEQ
ncbi:MAG: TM0106 family RecB-like putative nuclease [Candidatus Eremiobacteraeota bacterium]|nr:TM0106 family RecB-like putative nuclease [Candidatus Eremiobacteraeota bacterium]